MPDFHFPLLFLTPDFEGDEIALGRIALVKRKWATSTFDLATLATRHKLHLPYQLIDVVLGSCNLEMRISADTYDEANRIFSAVRLGMYAVGMSPTLAPYVATHSVNDYSGINSRDSEMLRQELPEGLREGFISADGSIEIWPRELSFQCITLQYKLNVTKLRLSNGVKTGEAWLDIVKKKPALKVIEDAAIDAPRMGHMDQSLLHIWCALEALFPDVQSEVAYRISMYLGQLIGAPNNRKSVYDDARKAYNVRSKVAHGSTRGVTVEQWLEPWKLLMFAITAIVVRGGMPADQDLLDELLAPSANT